MASSRGADEVTRHTHAFAVALLSVALGPRTKADDGSGSTGRGRAGDCDRAVVPRCQGEQAYSQIPEGLANLVQDQLMALLVL